MGNKYKYLMVLLFMHHDTTIHSKDNRKYSKQRYLKYWNFTSSYTTKIKMHEDPKQWSLRTNGFHNVFD